MNNTKKRTLTIVAVLMAATLVVGIETFLGATTALAIPLYDHIWRIQYPGSNQMDLLCISNTLPNGNLSGFLVSNYAGTYRIYNTISEYYNQNTSIMWFFADGPLSPFISTENSWLDWSH
jgi:hypothetical protein